jgi:ribosomal protein S18 acetylase RimI-like enzyme
LRATRRANIITVDIRFCTKYDFAQILSINAASQYAWSSNILYHELFKKEYSTCLGAFSLSDNKLIGYGILDVSKKISCILNIIVTEEHRRKGIGSQILLALSEVAQAYGFKRINLRVRLNNTPALSLYTMFGFTEDEIILNYYNNGESALLMSASLPLNIPGDDFDYE